MLRWATLLDLLHGAGTTLLISLLAIALGVPLGLGISLARARRVPVLGTLCAVYSSFVRASPVVLFVMFVFFGLPALGVSLSPYAAAVAALALNTAAFNAEIWRAAILDVPRGQLDSARAMGMTGGVTFRRIVFPQIWRMSLPALVSEMTLLIKASPAIAVIGVVDLTRKARQVAAVTYAPLPPFFTAMVLYAVTLMLLVVAARGLERHVRARYAL
jgi:His/Glu/Gln/Arg/opine family amino acid ABC transporter permease subunit